MPRSIDGSQAYAVEDMRKRGMTQTDIARTLGISRATVNRLNKLNQAYKDAEKVRKQTAKREARATGRAATPANPDLTSVPPAAPPPTPVSEAMQNGAGASEVFAEKRLEEADPLTTYAVSADLTRAFLTDNQIAAKHRTTLAFVSAVRRALAKGRKFEQPPGFMEHDDEVTVTPERRVDALRASILEKAQAMLDALTPDRIADMTADKLASSAASLMKVHDAIAATAARKGYGELVARANNALALLGTIDPSADARAALLRLTAPTPACGGRDADGAGGQPETSAQPAPADEGALEAEFEVLGIASNAPAPPPSPTPKTARIVEESDEFFGYPTA